MWMLSSAKGSHCLFSERNLLFCHHPGWFRDFHGTLLANNSIECSPVLPKKALPGDKWWRVVTLYVPLLGIFIGITTLHSRKFPLHWVSTPVPQDPPAPAVFLYSATPSYTWRQCPSPPNPNVPVKTISSTFWKIYTPPPRPFLSTQVLQVNRLQLGYHLHNS